MFVRLIHTHTTVPSWDSQTGGTMTQGIWTENGDRFPSKKAMKDAVTTASLEATSIFGNEYDGPITFAPAGDYFVVGPDPYTSRKWYAHINVKSDGKVTVK
jgi:hypothetical protein